MAPKWTFWIIYQNRVIFAENELIVSYDVEALDIPFSYLGKSAWSKVLNQSDCWILLFTISPKPFEF